MTKKRKLQEIFFKLGLLAFFGLLYVAAIPYSLKTKQFPQLIAICTMIVITWSLITDFFGKASPASETKEHDDKIEVDDAMADGAMNRRFYEAWAIILIATAVSFLGGFLFMVFFLFLGFGLRSASRKKALQNIVIAVLSTAIIYYIFQELVGIPLLDGILW
jgi:hypothetical protein